MAGETAPTGSSEQAPVSTAWDTLAGEPSPDERQEIEDKLANISDWLKSGRIDEARAAELRDEVTGARAKRDKEQREAMEYWLASQDDAPSVQPGVDPNSIPPTPDVIPPAPGVVDPAAASLDPNLVPSDPASAELTAAQAQALAEAQARELAEAQARLGADALSLTAEQIAALTPEETEAYMAAIRHQQEELAIQMQPLIAINANFTVDRNALARDLAERSLNDELAASKNPFKRLWKGTLFKKAYTIKYTNEFISGDRKDENGKSVDELIEGRSSSALERFIMGTTNQAFVHEGAGEKLEVDQETTERVRPVIAEFAQRYAAEFRDANGQIVGLTPDREQELRNILKGDLARLSAEARDEGKPVDNLLIDNYFEVARNAALKLSHERGIESAMEGFAVYNAEVRDGIRTEAHRDKIDRLTEWLETRKIGNKTVDAIVPAQFLAMGVSIASGLIQTGARSAASVLGFGLGGAAVSAGLSGLKERNRITEDRVRMMRDAAMGIDYNGTAEGVDIKDLKGREKRSAKYEAKIGGTLYDMRPASELTEAINAALSLPLDTPGRQEILLNAIKEARVRIDISDETSKDLIGYSSAEKIGDERLALDRALITAEMSLSDSDRQLYADQRTALDQQLTQEISKQDKTFNRERAWMAAKKAGKSFAIGAINFLGSQEIKALLDDNTVGLVEKIRGTNADAQNETLLAKGFGAITGNRGQFVANPEEAGRVLSEQLEDTPANQARMQELREQGYSEERIRAEFTSYRTAEGSVAPADSASRVDVVYDGWANNGTKVSDGNELRAYLQDGQFISGMRGNSTMGNQVFNYEQLASEGRVKGFLTIGGAKFEVVGTTNAAGQISWGENGVFTTAAGDTIKAIGDNGEKLYKYFEIAVDNGVDENGLQHIIPLATDIGRNVEDVLVQSSIQIPVENPAVLEFVRTIAPEMQDRGTSFAGAFFAPETARNGLGRSGVAAEAPAAEPDQTNVDYTTANNPVAAPAAAPIPPAPGEPAPVAPGAVVTNLVPEAAPAAPAPEAVPPAPAPASTSESAPAPETAPAPEQPSVGQIIEEVGDMGPENLDAAVLRARAEQIGNEIIGARDLLGSDGVAMLTNFNTDSSAQDNYGNWYSSLSDEQKAAVANIMNDFFLADPNNQIPMGRGFRLWWAMNNPDTIL